MTHNWPEKIKQAWRNPWINNTIWIIGALVIYLLLRPYFQGDVVRDQAPDFQVQTLSGDTIQLSELQGDSLLIHFWATWCPICTFSRDGVEKIAQDYRVLSIATQSGSDAELLAYAQEHGMNPAWIINDQDGQLFRRYGAKAVPADFIINRYGDVQFVEVGVTSSWGLRARLWWSRHFAKQNTHNIQSNPHHSSATLLETP